MFTYPISRIPRAAWPVGTALRAGDEVLFLWGHTPEEALARRWRMLNRDIEQEFRTLRRQVREAFRAVG